MNQETNRELKPKLRFPEFRDEPAWTQKRLADAATLVTERAGNKECTPYTVTTGVGLVSQHERFGRTIAGNQLKTYYVLQKNDFAYNKSATKASPEGFIARYLGDERAAVPNSIFTCFRVDEEVIDPAYLDYLFTSNLHGRWLKKYITVGARAHGSLNVNDADLMSLPVPLPSGTTSLREQQRVAQCLSSLDEVIAALTQKVDALKAHKQGLMQRLFPREGETLPRLRFPEFRDAREWAWIPLGKLLARKPEYGVNAPSVPFSENLPTYLRITDISDDGQFISGTKASVDIDATDEHYLSEGDIALARTGASVGKSYRYRKEDGKLVFAGFLIQVRPNPTQLNPTFLSNFLSTGQYWDWVRITSARSGQPGINGTEYATLPVPIPSSAVVGDSLREQQRIADCLSYLDDLIAAQVQELDALKTHKNGLMQQLFLSPEEVDA